MCWPDFFKKMLSTDHIDVTVCPPKDSNVEQAIRIVVQYIDGHPARLQENFYDLAVEALRAAWRGICH